MAAFKLFSFLLKSMIAASNAFLAFFCSVVRTFFLAPIPAAAGTPALTPALIPALTPAVAAVAGTATTPAINENAAAKATVNLVIRERKFIKILKIGREVGA